MEAPRYKVWMRRPGGYGGSLTKALTRERAEAWQARITLRQPVGTQVWIERSN